MEILELAIEDGRLIDRFDSQQARHVGVARIEGRGGVSIIRLGAEGVLGRHPAVADQLFYVIDGDGWVAAATASGSPSGRAKPPTGARARSTSQAARPG